jgi:hypothetical protein
LDPVIPGAQRSAHSTRGKTSVPRERQGSRHGTGAGSLLLARPSFMSAAPGCLPWSGPERTLALSRPANAPFIPLQASLVRGPRSWRRRTTASSRADRNGRSIPCAGGPPPTPRSGRMGHLRTHEASGMEVPFRSVPRARPGPEVRGAPPGAESGMDVPFRSGRRAARGCVQGAARGSACERNLERTFHSASHVLPGQALLRPASGPRQSQRTFHSAPRVLPGQVPIPTHGVTQAWPQGRKPEWTFHSAPEPRRARPRPDEAEATGWARPLGPRHHGDPAAQPT